MITRYKADKSFLIAPEGQKTPVEAYLDIKRMMEIAREQQVVVVHPGYGFLAENAEFAREVKLNPCRISKFHQTIT